ncbi:MAG: carboxypeptidase regulatory-like domain-containing protein [Actinobacteria bacterium]|nr:carboxypeptidase regulatory-like domain-containing protein [Actinomycetota bacterium]
MQTGRAFNIAAIVGTVVLIPVIIILGLGIYGTAVTGDNPLDRSAGPVMRIEPPSGSLGTAITVRGAKWEPRTLVKVELLLESRRPEVTALGTVVDVRTTLPPVYVGEAIVSRAGTFAIDAQLPTTLPLVGPGSVVFAASAAYRGGEEAGDARAAFEIEAGAGRVTVMVQTAQGAAGANALVELRGKEAQLVAAARTGAAGVASFQGLPPGVVYEASARLPGFGTLRGASVTTSVEPASVTLQVPSGPQGRVYVGGVAAGGAESPRTMAVMDLSALLPMEPRAAEAAATAWAMTADPQRGWLYLADETATEIRTVDAKTGGALPSIPLAFDLRAQLVGEAEEAVPYAEVRLFWNVRGQRVLVRSAVSDADGRVRFDGLIANSTFEVTATAPGYALPVDQRPRVTIAPNQTQELIIRMRGAGGARTRSPAAQLTPPLRGSTRAPATALVVSDLAVDPVSGRLYVTGSDLARGHLFVLDPATRVIVHDWPAPTGVGDIVPAGDGRTVFLANRPYATVTRVDADTGTVEQSAVVASWPESIAVDGGGTLYVASLRDGRVTKLDGRTLAPIASRALDAGLNRVAMHPDGATVLVSNLWTNTVTALRTDDLTVTYLLPVAPSPRALAVDGPTRTLVVASAERGIVAVYDTETYELRQSLALEVPVNDVALVVLRA